MKRPYSLRTWMLVGIVGLVLIPYVGTGILAFLTEVFEPPRPEGPPRRDPAVVEALDRHELEVIWHEHGSLDFQVRQRYALFQHALIVWVGIPMLVIGTIALAIRLASRAALNPLQTLSVAAGKINRHELDFDVPTSPIREVNELATAFDQMRSGLKESLTRQAEMEQERRMFIAAMAHDLRTPLTSVRGYLEGLRDGVAHTPEKRDRYVAVALDKAERMERLIESLFTFAKSEYLGQPPQMEPLVLGELLDGAAAGLRPLAEAKGVALRLDEGPAPCRLNGDPLMLARVVDNLLDNAIRHTPAGGKIELGWRGGVDHCRFWVHDSGPGIPPDELSHVFQPLYRGDKSRGGRTGGAGLGLAIAQRLVEAHGGEMSVESRLGATFTVVLPVSPHDL